MVALMTSNPTFEVTAQCGRLGVFFMPNIMISAIARAFMVIKRLLRIYV
jgi:hypothetical protein